MLTYIETFITAVLVLAILRAPRRADATGYLLVSGLMPVPVLMMGQRVNEGVFPTDVCLLSYVFVHGLPALDYAIKRRSLPAGLVPLIGLSVLATCSGAFNFYFVDQDSVKFYAFTIVKFCEYALLGIALIANRPDTAQLRKICTIVLAGILVYEILHALHISGIVRLSGQEYFGAGAQDSTGRADFVDPTGWFLASYRPVVGGTASINAWFSLLVFEAYRGAVRRVAAATAILAVFSIFATTSRSDIVGLAVGATVFALYAPSRQWKTYVCGAIAVGGLYAGLLIFVSASAERTTAMTRISELWNPELRAEGTYADRSSDRASLLSYLAQHPRELLIGVGPGNFHRYQTQGITKNYFGHNSFLHWTGELGLGGFLLLIAWCLAICSYAKKRLRSVDPIPRLAARICLALVTGRVAAGWGAESLLGTDHWGSYSLFFVGFVYLLASTASFGHNRFSLGRARHSAEEHQQDDDSSALRRPYVCHRPRPARAL